MTKQKKPKTGDVVGWSVLDIDDVRELFEEWAKGRDLTPDTWGVTSYANVCVDNDWLAWVAAWKALAATGKQQGGEVQDSRALIHRYDTAGTNFRESLMDDYYDDTERVRRRKVLDAAHAELLSALSALSARQPMAVHGVDLSPIATRKLGELAAKGYVTNGVAIFNPATGQRGLVDNLGFVGWVNNTKEPTNDQ